MACSSAARVSGGAGGGAWVQDVSNTRAVAGISSVFMDVTSGVRSYRTLGWLSRDPRTNVSAYINNMEHTKTSFSIPLRGLGVFILALVLNMAMPVFEQPSLAQPASTSRPSDVLGLASVGHQVSDLERSITFF